MRTKYKIKVGLQGSSDISHLQTNKLALEKAHKEFTHSFFALHQAINSTQVFVPRDETLVTIKIFGKTQTVPYGRIKELGFAWEYASR